jgi:lipid II:glycine glycyltransferase (peptidoglycan interpeptide bridge formation enzyme)
MELNFTSEIPQADYDRFVTHHASSSFLQSWDWGEWMVANGKTPARVAVTDSAGNILLAAQIFLTSVPKIRGQYLYIPYGPLVADGAPAETIKFFLEQVKKLSPNSAFLRIEPKQNFSAPGKLTKHIQPGKTLVLNLEKSGEELLAEMHQKTRYNIKVAQRHGVEIKTGASADALKLIDETSSRQGYKNHPLSYYQKMVEFFGGSQALTLKVYSAEYQSQLLASSLMIDYGPARTYLFGGTSNDLRNVMAPYLLHWQAIQDAKAAGLKAYDFWGIETASGKTPGFVRFKLGWGGTAVQYPVAQDIVYKPLWYNGYKLLRSLNRKFS